MATFWAEKRVFGNPGTMVFVFQYLNHLRGSCNRYRSLNPTYRTGEPTTLTIEKNRKTSFFPVRKDVFFGYIFKSSLPIFFIIRKKMCYLILFSCGTNPMGQYNRWKKNKRKKPIFGHFFRDWWP